MPIPMNTDKGRFEEMQYLPGLRRALEGTLDDYNRVLENLGIGHRLELRERSLPAVVQPAASSVLALRQSDAIRAIPIVEATTKSVVAAAKKPMAEVTKKKLSRVARKRWAEQKRSGKQSAKGGFNKAKP